MKHFAAVALLLACSCSDPGHSPTIGTADDGLGTGGESSGTGGESNPGTGGIVATAGSGGAATGTGGLATGGVEAARGGAAAGAAGAGGSAGVIHTGSLGEWCSPGGECDAGSTCYADRCTKSCATDAECATGERCGEMYKGGNLSGTNRPPLGCLTPCHIPGIGNDVSGCGSGEFATCEFYIGSRIVGADDGNWLPMPDPCVGGAHFCAATGAVLSGMRLCTGHVP